MKVAAFASAVTGLSLFSNVLAAEPADEILVTATRTAQTADQTLASVSVITRADIERSQVKSIAELLTGLAGVDSSVSGGYGKVTSFYLRGTNDNHVLVLIDGVRAGSATLGTTAFEFLPISEIERIEIVRGPASSLYGSNAIGGVIQIFTRHATKPFQVEADAGYGTYDTGNGSAGVSGEHDGTRYSLHVTRFHTGGFDAQRNLAPTPYGPTADQPDRDGYTDTGTSLSLSHRFTNGANLEASMLDSRGETEFDGIYTRMRFEQRTWSARAGVNLLPAWFSQLAVGANLDAADNFLADNTLGSRIVTQRETAAWQNDFTLAEKHLVTVGVDYLTEDVSGTVAYNNTTRDNTAGFLQYLGEFGAFSMQLSGRHDQNSTYGGSDTGRIALGLRLAPSLRLSASHGTAFKAPTFNDLYWPTDTSVFFGTTYITMGNPDIQPEYSRSDEVGLSYQPTTSTRLGINVFATDIKNLINWNTTLTAPSTYTTMPENVARAHINGAEAQLRTALAGWTAQAAYTWLDPRDEATDLLLPRRAQGTFRLDLDRNYDRLHVGAGWLVQGRRYDDPANTVRLGGYGVLNLRAQYDLSKTWWLRARLDNVADKQYETAATYNTPGRSLFVSLGYQGR